MMTLDSEKIEIANIISDAKIALCNAKRSLEEVQKAYEAGMTAIKELGQALSMLELQINPKKEDMRCNSEGKAVVQDKWLRDAIADLHSPEGFKETPTTNGLYNLLERLRANGQIEEQVGGNELMEFHATDQGQTSDLGAQPYVSQNVDVSSKPQQSMDVTDFLEDTAKTSISLSKEGCSSIYQPFIPEYELFSQEVNRNLRFVLMNDVERGFKIGKGADVTNISTILINLPIYAPTPTCYSEVKEIIRTGTDNIRLLPVEVWDRILHGYIGEWLPTVDPRKFQEKLKQLRQKYASQIDNHMLHLADYRKNGLGNKKLTYQKIIGRKQEDQLELSRPKTQPWFINSTKKLQ